MNTRCVNIKTYALASRWVNFGRSNELDFEIC